MCADQIISGYPGRDLIQIADHHSGGEVAQRVEDNLSKRLKIVGYCPKSSSSELLLRTSTDLPGSNEALDEEAHDQGLIIKRVSS